MFEQVDTENSKFSTAASAALNSLIITFNHQIFGILAGSIILIKNILLVDG